MEGLEQAKGETINYELQVFHKVEEKTIRVWDGEYRSQVTSPLLDPIISESLRLRRQAEIPAPDFLFSSTYLTEYLGVIFLEG